jgi:D-alanyl-lipoteichoic acid acyltransferase DltB (MBOAT superfamily)
MLFNSPEFAVFFAIVSAAYWLLRDRFRAQNVLLLVAAFIFYGWWDVRFQYLIALSTALDFSAGLMIARGRMSARQRLGVTIWLAISAFLFLAIRWDAIGFSLRPASVTVDWASLWTRDRSIWAAIGFSAASVLAAHLAYPWLANMEEERRRKLTLVLGIIANLAILGFFKYFNFFADSFRQVWQAAFGYEPNMFVLKVVLPVGISFYTFQSMAYTIELYRRRMEPSEDLIEYATYVSFFPQLVAGPIERPAHLLSQFQAPRPKIDGATFRDGVWLIGWGLFKKMVIADNMAVLVNQNFAPFDKLAGGSAVPSDGLRLLFTLYAFALQIYGDFSGYTDIARGVAKLLGFELILNFNLPYFAITPSDFWRRWHISLSSWLRDYLYIPLGGNRGGPSMVYRNLFLTMLIGGLWHGAAWTFVLWGIYHGILLIAYRLVGLGGDEAQRPLPLKLVMGLVMFHLTCLGWLLFRAQNLATIGIFLQSIVLHPQGSPEAWQLLRDILYYSWFLILFQAVQLGMRTLNPMPRLHWFVQLNVWVFLVMSILRLPPATAQQFIYFAF